MCQINSYKVYLFLVFLISQKNWRVRYRKVIFQGNVHAVPKIVSAITSVRYKSVRYIGGFL